MAKQSRKELLKREDAFILAAEEGAAWVKKNQTPLVAALAILVVGGAAVWGTSAFLHQRDRDAAQIFAQGWKIFEDGVVEGDALDPNGKTSKTAMADKKHKKKAQGDDDKDNANAPTFASEKEQWMAARGKFQEVVDRVGYKGVGAMAGFLVGDLDEKLGEGEAAEQVFVELTKALTAKDHLYFLAAERVAYLHEARGDTEGAIAALRDLAADDKLFYADYAQFHQARLYLAKDDRDKARGLLEHIDKSFPNSSLIDDVRTKLGELGEAGGVAALTQPGSNANDKARP